MAYVLSDSVDISKLSEEFKSVISYIRNCDITSKEDVADEYPSINSQTCSVITANSYNRLFVEPGQIESITGVEEHMLRNTLLHLVYLGSQMNDAQELNVSNALLRFRKVLASEKWPFIEMDKHHSINILSKVCNIICSDDIDLYLDPGNLPRISRLINIILHQNMAGSHVCSVKIDCEDGSSNYWEHLMDDITGHNEGDIESSSSRVKSIGFRFLLNYLKYINDIKSLDEVAAYSKSCESNETSDADIVHTFLVKMLTAILNKDIKAQRDLVNSSVYKKCAMCKIIYQIYDIIVHSSSYVTVLSLIFVVARLSTMMFNEISDLVDGSYYTYYLSGYVLNKHGAWESDLVKIVFKRHSLKEREFSEDSSDISVTLQNSIMSIMAWFNPLSDVVIKSYLTDSLARKGPSNAANEYNMYGIDSLELLLNLVKDKMFKSALMNGGLGELAHSISEQYSLYDLEINAIFGGYQWQDPNIVHVPIFVITQSSNAIKGINNTVNISNRIRTMWFLEPSRDGSLEPRDNCINIYTLMKAGYYYPLLGISDTQTYCVGDTLTVSRVNNTTQLNNSRGLDSERTNYSRVGLVNLNTVLESSVSETASREYNTKVKVLNIVKVIGNLLLKIDSLNMDPNAKQIVQKNSIQLLILLGRQFRWLVHHPMYQVIIRDAALFFQNSFKYALDEVDFSPQVTLFELFCHPTHLGSASYNNLFCSRLLDSLKLLNCNMSSDVQFEEGYLVCNSSSNASVGFNTVVSYGLILGFLFSIMVCEPVMDSALIFEVISMNPVYLGDPLMPSDVTNASQYYENMSVAEHIAHMHLLMSTILLGTTIILEEKFPIGKFGQPTIQVNSIDIVPNENPLLRDMITSEYHWQDHDVFDGYLSDMNANVTNTGKSKANETCDITLANIPRGAPFNGEKNGQRLGTCLLEHNDNADFKVNLPEPGTYDYSRVGKIVDKIRSVNKVLCNLDGQHFKFNMISGVNSRVSISPHLYKRISVTNIDDGALQLDGFEHASWWFRVELGRHELSELGDISGNSLEDMIMVNHGQRNFGSEILTNTAHALHFSLNYNALSGQDVRRWIHQDHRYLLNQYRTYFRDVFGKKNNTNGPLSQQSKFCSTLGSHTPNIISSIKVDDKLMRHFSSECDLYHVFKSKNDLKPDNSSIPGIAHILSGSWLYSTGLERGELAILYQILNSLMVGSMNAGMFRRCLCNLDDVETKFNITASIAQIYVYFILWYCHEYLWDEFHHNTMRDKCIHRRVFKGWKRILLKYPWVNVLGIYSSLYRTDSSIHSYSNLVELMLSSFMCLSEIIEEVSHSYKRINTKVTIKDADMWDLGTYDLDDIVNKISHESDSVPWVIVYVLIVKLVIDTIATVIDNPTARSVMEVSLINLLS